jgi:hypothetical protein
VWEVLELDVGVLFGGDGIALPGTSVTSGLVGTGSSGPDGNRAVSGFLRTVNEETLPGSGLERLGGQWIPGLSLMTEWGRNAYTTPQAANWTTSSQFLAYLVELRHATPVAAGSVGAISAAGGGLL